MKFAAFTAVAASAGEATNAADLLDNLRQQTILAEELGFEAMWLGKHHFGPHGVGNVPNPTWASPPWGGGGTKRRSRSRSRPRSRPHVGLTRPNPAFWPAKTARAPLIPMTLRFRYTV